MLRSWVLAVIFGLLSTSAALAHIERPGYWPDPAPDTSVSPAAGGGVPKIRSLASALDRKRTGTTRVVCQRDSMSLLRIAVGKARREGYFVRPTDKRNLSARSAKRLLKLNGRLRRMCRYREIQPAVTASGNNDRVVVMPGVYTEPTARAQPTHDERCDQYEVNTEFGDPGALSYDYQWHCPNDQNLIAVMGREPNGAAPDPPRRDRHGIPNPGPCVRCNFQIEGSGVSADDVVVDAGRVESGNKGPAEPKKDVGIRADRADGFVLRNMTFRHAREQAIYVLETDGYVFDRFKVFYAGSYGTLTFVADHGVHSNCEGAGHTDSAVYPGAAVETGVQRPEGTPARLNQEVKLCDLHHNLSGFSATNGNAIHVHHNNFYDNALGLTTDVITGAGHPGYPGDSMIIEKNNFYANNFNVYDPNSDVEANFPFPVGTGMWIAGGNHHQVRDNHFYDNWRRGTMVFTVPDALACGPQTDNQNQAGCEAERNSVSHWNRHYGNKMGVSPDGKVLPNGTDFWWDSFPGARGNCWYGNTGPRPITMSPDPLPDCNNGTDPTTSTGVGSPTNEGELASCVLAFETREYENSPCPWVSAPSKPGSRAARRQARRESAQRAANRRALLSFCSTIGTPAVCEPFRPFLEARGLRLDPELASLQLSSPRSLTAWGLAGPAATTTTVPLGQYTCANWRTADDVERKAIVRRLTTFTGGRIVSRGISGFGTVLPTELAYNHLDQRCAQPASDAFLLYKLYGHAAGFAGVLGPAELLD